MLVGRGVQVSRHADWTFLRREGPSFKKTLFGLEQSRADVARRRRRWKSFVGKLDPKKLISIDITIPNSQFADVELVNWAMCDQMMIQTTIGIRYETDSDQFRFMLAEIRRTMYAHPRIDNDTVRVRFDGFGDSSLNIQIRVYAKTRE